MYRKSGILVSSVILFLFACLPAWSADPDTELGVKLFKQQKYGQAIKAFNRALKRSPKESGLYYFLGACYDQGGDKASAKKLYGFAIQLSPSSESAQLAAKALGKIDPAYLQSVVDAATRSPGNSPGPSSSHTTRAPRATSSQQVGIVNTHSNPHDVNSLPSECRVYYEPMANHQIVTASVNGRSIKMLFDTGAEMCAFGKNHMDQLGVRIPSDARVGASHGVGAGGTQTTYNFPVTLKVGQIERRNFEISVQPHMDGEPLLGESFFKDFHYTIDAHSKSIHFVRNDVNESAGRSAYAGLQKSAYDVPFRREGKEMVVKVKVNDRDIDMYFDTGAFAIALTREHASQLRLAIPEDAQQTVVQGVAGPSPAWVFPVRSVKMGPIEKRNHMVSVVENAQMPHPLLGQEFFADWRYAVDNVNQVIRFRR
ncbi:MAG: retroviral-like aspartic protease family protein [Cyanobacteria bacterium HKST-UBA02]|nr:retroviral-like aspartic protease family protein [Cyanobacteria bacterium HKST-UBA02]